MIQMAEAESSVFRKSSLERVTSPEQLNEYIKVTNPNLIIILSAIFIILISGGIWLFTSEIPKFVDIVGVVATEFDNKDPQKLYCYVPLAVAKRLKTDMEARISPEYAPKEEFGYKKGKILQIGDTIVTNLYLTQKFVNPMVLAPVLNNGGNLIEIIMEMGEWTNEQSNEIELCEGTLCNVSVVTGNQNALNLIF
jgi:hypothetical protein